MRALCGAIISAGALIGLGLTALGYGLRYQGFGPAAINERTNQLYGIPSLVLILVVLLLALFVGVVVAFVGLAFHHERRYRERMREVKAHEALHSVS
jgi:hypothetical protein